MASHQRRVQETRADYHQLLNQLDDPRGLDEHAERIAADLLYALHRAPYTASGTGDTEFSLSLSDTYTEAYGDFDTHPSISERRAAYQESADDIAADAREKFHWCDDSEVAYINTVVNSVLNTLETYQDPVDEDGDQLYETTAQLVDDIRENGIEHLIREESPYAVADD